MKAILFLLIILFIYYQVYYRFPHYVSTKTHIYLGVFTVGYLILYYILNYQRVFAYNVLKNMDSASNKPLYDINSLYSKENKVDMLKNHLANKQGMRCINCQNPILQNDLNMYKINYIKPLEYGGYNNIHNLGLSCSTCNAFRPF